MKKKLFVCMTCIVMIGSADLKAQVWGATTVPTTTSGNCGIGGNAGVGGKLSIGTTTSDARLRISSILSPVSFPALSIPAIKIDRAINEESEHFVAPNIFEIWQGSYSSLGLKFVITNDVNVGIGLASPAHKLDVAGDINASTDISAGGDLTVSGNTTVGADITVSGDATVSGSATISTLANAGGGRLVTANASGTLDVEYAPTLSVSSNTLQLSNGATVNTSVSLPTWADNLSISGNSLSLKSGATTLNTVTIPSGADNLGNHTATGTLHMSHNDIDGINEMYFYSGGALRMSSSLYFTNPLGVGTSASGYELYVNGDGYATGTFTSSDKRFKKNIENIKSVTDELFKVQSHSYNFRKDEFKDRNFDDKLHFGFIAQEVEEVFPNLVKKDDNGYYAVNYTEFIPLLLQSLKEEDQKVKELETKIAALESKLGNTAPTYTDNTTNTTAKSVLYQNTPNPFNVETNIKYNIVSPYSSAFIGVYDLNGRQLQRINIASGSNQVAVKGLASGMYVYSLIVDGQLIDSKKMVMLDDK